MTSFSSIYPAGSIILAPLAGYTDPPFRSVCRRKGCYHAFTPLVEAGSLVYRWEKSKDLLCRREDEPWLGVQLLGQRPDLLCAATRILDACEHDIIDFNMGCPVKKVVKRGAGAALCHDKDEAARCVETIVENTQKPVTAKIRLVDSIEAAPTIQLAQTLEFAGVQALTVHARTLKGYYSATPAPAVVKQVAKSTSVPVVFNGGIYGAASAQKALTQSGCSRLMVARGTIGNPWIFGELQNEEFLPPTHEEICGEIFNHVSDMVDFYGEEQAMRRARKIVPPYLAGRGYSRKLRGGLNQLTTFQDFLTFHRTLQATPPTENAVVNAQKPIRILHNS